MKYSQCDVMLFGTKRPSENGTNKIRTTPQNNTNHRDLPLLIEQIGIAVPDIFET
jgi:hypothetical protein